MGLFDTYLRDRRGSDRMEDDFLDDNGLSIRARGRVRRTRTGRAAERVVVNVRSDTADVSTISSRSLAGVTVKAGDQVAVILSDNNRQVAERTLQIIETEPDGIVDVTEKTTVTIRD